MEGGYQGGVSGGEGDNFHRLSQTIASNIKKITQNVSSMSKMVNQLQTPQDSHELRNQLRQIQDYTHKLVKDTSSLIMELMKVPLDQPASKMARERLSDEYMATLNAFQSTQRLAAQKTKEEVRRVKAQSFKLGDPMGVTHSGNQENLMELGETDLRQQQQAAIQSERELLELEEYERDIRQLEENIRDGNQIFVDLGRIIHAQGQLVDSIETNVESAAYQIEMGTQEVQEAASYKNKLRKRKVYIGVILTIVIVIILVLIFTH